MRGAVSNGRPYRDRIDDMRLRIEQLVETGISPRLRPQIIEVRVSQSESVLVARIAKSWAAPHRVTLGGDNNFYGRHSSGKYQMDVDQLRSAFTLSTNVTERIKEIHRHLISDALAQQDDPVRHRGSVCT